MTISALQVGAFGCCRGEECDFGQSIFIIVEEIEENVSVNGFRLHVRIDLRYAPAFR